VRCRKKLIYFVTRETAGRGGAVWRGDGGNVKGT